MLKEINIKPNDSSQKKNSKGFNEKTPRIENNNARKRKIFKGK